MNAILKYLHHKYIATGERWYPMLAVFYLTYECRFRCPYCSDGFGRPYYRLKEDALPLRDAREVVRRIRESCDRIVITGGEPNLYPRLDDLLSSMREMKFREVVFTTSGANLGPHLSAMAESVTSLVISIDTLDEVKADAWSGAGAGTLAGILDSVEAARAQRGAAYDICISSVVTPENIADLYDVYRYACARGFMYSASPQLVGVTPHEKLIDNPAYRRFYGFLIHEKKNGARVFGSPLYLQYMRDLRQFTCRPLTMLVVSPGGDVFYPCLERGKPAGNLLQFESLHKARSAGRDRFGPLPRCGNQCQSPCALGFALALDYPGSILSEGRRMLVPWRRTSMPAEMR